MSFWLSRPRATSNALLWTWFLCGSELKVRPYVGDLDLDALTLGAVVFLPVALDELAGHEDPHLATCFALGFSVGESSYFHSQPLRLA